jgi:hypothetical protein
MYYLGDVNEGVSNAISSKLEKILERKIQSRKALKRIFYVFIEAIQNIRIHSFTDDAHQVQTGIIVYTQAKNICTLVVNVVSHEQAALLATKYGEINEITQDALKAKYLDILKNGEISEQGGAGLGIITIAMRSTLPIAFEIIKIDDKFALFQSTYCVKID